MDNWLKTRELPVHLLSAAGLVFWDGKVLLIRSQRRGWEIPGGIVEQGEAIPDGLRREIFEESGIYAVPKHLVGIYQRLSQRPGYGPLEGMKLPQAVNLTFVCEYEGGVETVSEESVEVGWFPPEEAEKMITSAYVMQSFRDIIEFDGRQRFRVFEQDEDGRATFLSECRI